MVVKLDWILKFFPTVQVCISLLLFDRRGAVQNILILRSYMT